jgi:hypothetical protein
MRDALAGNNDAKKYLRDNVNRDAFLPFIDGQRKAGNEKLAKDLVDAVAWKGEGGQKFVDIVGPNKEAGRLYLGGNAEQAAAALKAFSDKFGGFSNFALAQTQHETPAKEWYAGSDGKLVAGSPINVPIAQKPDADKTRTGAAVAAAGSIATGSSPAGALSAAAITNFLTGTASCKGCHQDISFSGSSPRDFKATKNGKSFDLKGLATAIEQNASMKNAVSQSVKDQIKKWAETL